MSGQAVDSDVNRKELLLGFDVRDKNIKHRNLTLWGSLITLLLQKGGERCH